jgi:hypothetical protein
VIIGHRVRRHAKVSFSGVVDSAVGFPLYQLGHLYKTRRDRTGSEFVADKNQQTDRKE